MGRTAEGHSSVKGGIVISETARCGPYSMEAGLMGTSKVQSQEEDKGHLYPCKFKGKTISHFRFVLVNICL